MNEIHVGNIKVGTFKMSPIIKKTEKKKEKKVEEVKDTVEINKEKQS